MDFGGILDAALAENQRQQLRMTSHKASLSSSQWLEEFATVSLSIGRATGKSSAIKLRASRSDLVVVKDAQEARWFKAETFNNPMVIHYAQLTADLNPTQGKCFDRIWVDNASTIDGLCEVLEAAVYTSAKQIILIG